MECHKLVNITLIGGRSQFSGWSHGPPPPITSHYFDRCLTFLHRCDETATNRQEMPACCVCVLWLFWNLWARVQIKFRRVRIKAHGCRHFPSLPARTRSIMGAQAGSRGAGWSRLRGSSSVQPERRVRSPKMLPPHKTSPLRKYHV